MFSRSKIFRLLKVLETRFLTPFLLTISIVLFCIACFGLDFTWFIPKTFLLTCGIVSSYAAFLNWYRSFTSKVLDKYVFIVAITSLWSCLTFLLLLDLNKLFSFVETTNPDSAYYAVLIGICAGILVYQRSFLHKIKIDPHVIDKVDNSPIYIVLIVSIFVINLGMVVYQWPFIHSFWLDEWISIKTASIYGTSSFPYFPSENPISSGFIYFFFLHIANVLTHNYLHAGRFLNLLFYLGALYPLFSLAKKYTNSRTALLALLIYSTSYFLLTLENEVRGYIFSVALFYLFLFLIVCIQQRILKYILSAVALAILLDNNLTNIWFVFTAYLTSFLWVILNRKREFYQVFFFISLGLPVCALLAYKGNPADAIAFYYHGLIGGLPPWASYRESVFYPYSYSWGNIATILVNTIALSGIIAMLLYARDKFLKNKLIYLIIWLVVSYIPIMLAGTPAGYRYFFITSPIWALAIALSVTEFFKGLSLGQRIAFGTIIATSLFSVGILNAQDVMWSKTLDFSQPANFIKNALPKDTIVIPNYMGVQIGDYGLPIKYILYDEEIFFYNENAGNYGKKNVLGNVFNAKSGKHFILDASYINIQDLENLMNNEPFSVVVFIRPWPSDITQNTYNQLSAVGFREVPNMQPFRLFVLEKE